MRLDANGSPRNSIATSVASIIEIFVSPIVVVNLSKAIAVGHFKSGFLVNSPVIDYKDIKLLTRYISEKGKMIPSRITNVARKKQKELSTAIKRARFLSLLSYTKKNY